MNKIKILIKTLAIPTIPKKAKLKYSGINLIGLMIGSALGIFIMSITIKILITINNNLQLIKAYSELEQSARLTRNFFDNIFNANGVGITSLSSTNSKVNNYFIDNNNNNAQFTLQYTSDDQNGAITCSGRIVNSINPTEHQTTICLGNPLATGELGYLTCNSPPSAISNQPISIQSARELMPLIDGTQIVRFFIAAIVAETTTIQGQISSNPTNYRIIPLINNIIPIIAPPPGTTITRHSVGIKIAILLRSRQQVLNFNKRTQFNDIFGFTEFSFNATDKFLYKLVIIQAPFPSNIKTPIMTTKISNIP